MQISSGIGNMNGAPNFDIYAFVRTMNVIACNNVDK